MERMKKSKFAFFVKKANGNYIVYSSLSGTVILVREDKYIKLLENALGSDTFVYSDDDFYNLMLEKKIFVEENIDEDLLVRGIYEEQIIRNKTLELMLIVTRQCNFRCIYCGQPHLDEKMDDVTYASVLKFVKNQILTHGYTSVRVTFFGGEPLLEANKICLFLEELELLLATLSTEEQKITYSSGMSTNGYLLSPETFEKLIEHNCDFYQISIDGMADVHNTMRPLVSGKPNWEKIIQNISYMLSTDKQFTILLRTNFNADVAESLIDFYKFVGEKLNDSRIQIYYETIKDHGNETTPETLCGTEELVFDIDIAQLIRENNLICSNSTQRLLPGSRVCYASKPNYYIIDEKSQILKCSFALDSPNNIVGVLDAEGNSSMNQNHYNNWVYRDYLSSETCKSCKALPLCFGKRCPKTLIQLGEVQCNVDMIQAEIEGLLDSYF